LKKEVKKIDEEWNSLLVEIRETVFNAAQGAQLYKRTQEFLQERRLLKMQMEELKNQYIILGGDEKLKELQECQDITKVGNKKGKYYYKKGRKTKKNPRMKGNYKSRK